MLTLTILGSNSAIPAYGRNPTAQLLQSTDASYLIDCGEATQIQMVKYKLKWRNLHHIFISHLHGDHYFGLIGLINSMALASRTAPLHVYGPPMLAGILDIQLKASESTLPFTLHFHALEHEGEILNDDKMSVQCFKTIHRIECWGFLFKQKKKPRKILPERVEAYQVPKEYFNQLQLGKDYLHPKGTIIPNEELTVAATPPKSYAYCADTAYTTSFVEKIKDVNLLYHEATYLEAAIDKAKERYHSTARQAADIALKVNAGKLIIGHYSSRYEVLDEFLNEAKEVFSNTELAIDGVSYTI